MLTLGYYGLTLLMLLLIVLGYSKAMEKAGFSKAERSREFRVFFVAFLILLVYGISLSMTKALYSLSLPRRILYMILLPFIIGLVIYYQRNKDNKALQAMPKTWPVYYQTFRIAVELLLLYTFYAGIIPETATFEGLNFDILMGISAPFVGYFLFRGEVKNRTLAMAWNILGIGMILFVVFIIATSIYLPQIWGSDVSLVTEDFFLFPYLTIPLFLAPSGIFMHMVSLMQLRKRE